MRMISLGRSVSCRQLAITATTVAALNNCTDFDTSAEPRKFISIAAFPDQSSSSRHSDRCALLVTLMVSEYERANSTFALVAILGSSGTKKGEPDVLVRPQEISSHARLFTSASDLRTQELAAFDRIQSECEQRIQSTYRVSPVLSGLVRAAEQAEAMCDAQGGGECVPVVVTAGDLRDPALRKQESLASAKVFEGVEVVACGFAESDDSRLSPEELQRWRQILGEKARLSPICPRSLTPSKPDAGGKQ